MSVKKGLIITGIIAGASLLAYTVYNYISVQAKLLTKLGYNFIGYKIIKFSKERIEVDITLEVENLSNIGFTLSGYDIDVSLNNQPMLKVKDNSLSQYVAPKDKSFVKLKISFAPTPVIKTAFNLENILNSILSPESIVFGFKGTVTAKTSGVLLKNFPIDEKLALSEMLPNNKKQKEVKA